jgi:hypothetical protein
VPIDAAMVIPRSLVGAGPFLLDSVAHRNDGDQVGGSGPKD